MCDNYITISHGHDSRSLTLYKQMLGLGLGLALARTKEVFRHLPLELRIRA